MLRAAKTVLQLLAFVLLAGQPGQTSPPDFQEVARLEAAGQFAEADALLAAQLGFSHPPDGFREINWERERLRRIRLDYSYTTESLFAALGKSLRDLHRREFDRWVAAGRFDSRVIDGERRFVASSVSNLYFRYPELNARRRESVARPELARQFLQTAQAIRSAAQAAGSPYVLPRRFNVMMEVLLKPGAIADALAREPRPEPPELATAASVAQTGERVRAWLPIPRRFPHQDQIELVRSEPAGAVLAPETAPIRSAYLEQSATAEGAATFRIEYTLRAWGVWFDLKPERIVTLRHDEPELAPFLSEAPHVRFTGPMRRLAENIAGRERNPLQRAKRYYDWIARNIRYSFAREYSTIRNLGEYCLENRYGDCGQETFLFMTLCRLSGIPARWQSGWSIFPGAETIHDWCEIYLPPYGWVPVDPYMGIYAMQYAPALSRRERRALRDFYFGGLDPYRLIANSDHCQELSPAKVSFRSDDVDFQRGELEVAGRNVYFGEFSYRLDWRELPGTNAE